MPRGGIIFKYEHCKHIHVSLNGMKLSNVYSVCRKIWYASCNNTFVRLKETEWNINPLPLYERSGKGSLNNNDILFLDRYKHFCSYEQYSEPYELYDWPLTNVKEVSYLNYGGNKVWHAYRNGDKIQIEANYYYQSWKIIGKSEQTYFNGTLSDEDYRYQTAYRASFDDLKVSNYLKVITSPITLSYKDSSFVTKQNKPYLLSYEDSSFVTKQNEPFLLPYEDSSTKQNKPFLLPYEDSSFVTKQNKPFLLPYEEN